MKTIRNTWVLLKSSWRVLKADKEIMLFPMIASFLSLSLIVAVGFWFAGNLSQIQAFLKLGEETIYVVYALAFVFYFVNYFIMTFFNAAIVACAVKRLRGGDPVFSDGIRAATGHLGPIVVWSFLSSTVGVLSGILQGKQGDEWIAARILSKIVDVSWALASFFVVPIMIVHGKSAVTSLKESASLLKKTWGQQIAGTVSFGAISALVIFTVIVPTALLYFLLQNAVLVVVLIVLEIFLLAITISAMEMVFQSALYLYASEGTVPPSFDKDLLAHAVTSK